MAALTEIRSIAEHAARKALEPTDVVDVQVERGIGSDGDELLWITIAVPDAQFSKIDDGKFISTLVTIKNSVRESGEDRMAIVRYITPSERIDDGDSES